MAGSFGSGRREINWDGVPDAFSAPNNLPGQLLQRQLAARRRLHARRAPAFRSAPTPAPRRPIEFGDIDPTYPTQFDAFSAAAAVHGRRQQRHRRQLLRARLDHAGARRAASAWSSPTSTSQQTSLEFFDASNKSLGTFFAPAPAGNETLLVPRRRFNAASVARVRITSGQQRARPAGTRRQTSWRWMTSSTASRRGVAAIPEPETYALMLTGLGVVAFFGRRRARKAAR